MPQQRICDTPAIVQFSHQILGGHRDVVEEHLAELLIARDGPDRPDPDARTVQIDQQEADPGLPRLRLRIGAHQREHPVGMMRPGRPDLVPAHHEPIALQSCPGREAGKIGARPRLGVALGPDRGAGKDRRQMLRLLGGGSELHEDGADVIEALRGQLWRADARKLLRHDDLLVEGRAHAAVLDGPMRRDPAFARERLVPGHQLRGWRTRRAPAQHVGKISLQPFPHLHAELGFGGRIMAEHGDYSTRMLAAFAIAVHCASSSANSLPNSAGVPILISAPRLAISCRVCGGARLSRKAALSLSMMAGGVSAGATTPSQNGACSLGKPASDVVGTSGSLALRSAPGTAKGRSFPDSMCGRLVVNGSATTWTSPATMAASMGAVPR